MKPASFLGLVTCASLVLASSAAFAGPGDQTAPKKKKPKTSVAAKAPKKTEAKADAGDSADKADKPEPVAPETKAADAKPVEASPTPAPAPASSSPPVVIGTIPSKDQAKEDDKKASFEEPGHFSVAPLLGYGSNYFGFGLGARAGYTLPQKLYVGGSLMYQFGSTYGIGSYLGGADYSSHIIYPAGEVGYELHAGPVTIRPYAGIGIAFLSSTVTYLNHEESSSTSSMILYPGATAHWNIPRSDFFVGGDARMAVLTKGGDPSFGFYATGGLRF
jgi:hypothetical protein